MGGIKPKFTNHSSQGRLRKPRRIKKHENRLSNGKRPLASTSKPPLQRPRSHRPRTLRRPQQRRTENHRRKRRPISKHQENFQQNQSLCTGLERSCAKLSLSMQRRRSAHSRPSSLRTSILDSHQCQRKDWYSQAVFWRIKKHCVRLVGLVAPTMISLCALT